jgi:hypothetical protein
MAANDVVRSPEDASWAAHQAGGDAWREETSVALALDGITTHGHASEEAWPYGTPCWPADRPAAARSPANQAALGAWHPLGRLALAEIEAELTAGHAVIVTTRVVYPAWRGADGHIDAEAGLKTPASHAVVAVGVLDGPARLVIKNSWGTDWGDRGYGYMSERYLDHYGLIAHVLEG